MTTWIPVDVPRVSVDRMHQATQTGGIFYPSSAAIGKQQKREAQERTRMDNLRDRRPTLTAVSPGRGRYAARCNQLYQYVKPGC